MLEAKITHLLPGGTDEVDTFFLTGLCKVGVLTQKTITGMDGLGAMLPGYPQDVVEIQAIKTFLNMASYRYCWRAVPPLTLTHRVVPVTQSQISTSTGVGL
jgi:hypothetical protein